MAISDFGQEGYHREQVANLVQAMDRLNADLGSLGRQIGTAVMRHAKTVEDGRYPVVPNLARIKREISREAGRILRGYFGGKAALRGQEARSDYAKIIVEGIRAGIRIEAKRHVNIVERYAKLDPVVWRWLSGMGIRPIKEGGKRYDPFHLFVYKDSPYRLSDRIWQVDQETRGAIDKLLYYHISRGTAAVDIADMLVGYLNPAERWRLTDKPYPKPFGEAGSYSARRLARTEITAAAGRATIAAAQINPYVTRIKWNLSGSHPEADICDQYASGGPKGDGEYPVEGVSGYPGHPFCLCYLTQIITQTPDQVTVELRAEIEARSEQAEALWGVFTMESLSAMLFDGTLDQLIGIMNAY